MDGSAVPGMATARLLGRAVERIEDADLLRGAGRFIDDLPVAPGTLHAAILRSPHPHAELVSLDASAALALAGVVAVVGPEEVRRWTRPFVVGVKQPMRHWCLAVERARYAGEPVAVVLAEDRYRAEDALDRLRAEWRALPAVVDPLEAAAKGAPVLHPEVGSNVVSDRRFRYGDPDAAFAAPNRVVSVSVAYPRSAVTPIECFGVIAEWRAGEGIYDVTANFSGPFAMHPVMAMALQVPANRLRLRTPPDSGGSFGVKQAVFPYAVLMAVCARAGGRPVKWIEDRLEHLQAATSGTGRRTTLDAAVTAEGEVTALRWDQLDECGGYLRAPEPATLYRMHGNLAGAYRVRHLDVRNRIVLTNRVPSGLTRGFGGPQLYFALERLMQRVAVECGLDPLETIRRNLIRADQFPYRTPSGAQYDSGDYAAVIDLAVERGDLPGLLRRRDAMRAEGRLYGIGHATVVEPSISNMGYIATVLTPEERRRAGPKDGAQASATVALDASGGISVHVASVPQGQGHRTVLAQVVGDAFGLPLDRINVVAELDTGRDAWSIASGNYSSRFAGAVAGAAHLAATRLRDRLARIAAGMLNVRPEAVRFAGGTAHAAGNPDASVPFVRLAGLSHWSAGTVADAGGPALRETAFWSPPELTPASKADEINSSATYGFVYDVCGVEVERATGRVRIDRYVTAHDAGRILNPAIVDGQVRGAFSNAVGAALYEEFAYTNDGAFLSGTFADYLVPTAAEVPEPLILHRGSASPVTPLGAKGVGEGNCMSTPVCLANAVADALGVAEVTLPLTPSRMTALLMPEEPAPPSGLVAPAPRAGGHGLAGEGHAFVAVPPAAVWATLLDPAALAAVVPGCESLRQEGAHAFVASVTIGVGPVRGRYEAQVALLDLDATRSLRLVGEGGGALGTGRGEGLVTLAPEGGGTRVRYTYTAEVGGKVAAVGGRMLDGAARILIGQFFAALAAQAGGPAGRSPGLLRRLLRLVGFDR